MAVHTPNKEFLRNGQRGWHKRLPGQRDADLRTVADLYLRGKTHMEIAEAISEARPYVMSIHMVGNDLVTLKKRWLEAANIDFSEAKARELNEIDRLEQTYWDAWERSQKPETIETIEKVEDSNSPNRKRADETVPSYLRTRAKKIIKSRDGGINFLQGIQWCIEQRCKIFGLITTTSNINVNWKEEALKAGVDPEKLENDLVQEWIAAASVGATGPSVVLGEEPEAD